MTGLIINKRRLSTNVSKKTVCLIIMEEQYISYPDNAL